MKKLKMISIILFIFGIIAIGYSVYNYNFEKKKSTEGLNQFDEVKEEVKASTKTTDKSDLKASNISCKLSFRDLNKQLIVFKGADEKTLEGGAGWLESSASIGQNGMSVIMGHRDTSLEFIQDIKVGEQIEAETLDNEYTYVVKKIDIVKPEQALEGNDTKQPTLRLITCYPFSYIGSAPDRFIVTCEKTS